jgi:hypothetical protein
MTRFTPYSFYSNLISSEELFEGLLGYGLFSEKLPPFLTSEYFLSYCKTNFPKEYIFGGKGKSSSIYYESIKNTNTPRPIGIPNPFYYHDQCLLLSNNWSKITEHFISKTKDNTHKISRIHLRKRAGSKSLFKMNYSNWILDPSPEVDLSFKSRYLIKADISNFFPSIYTHSIPWALVGKDKAKKTMNSKNNWYNQFDSYTRSLNNNETTGILIGPHTSNLLSEIILTVVDDNLNNKEYRFIRSIDDYECFVDNHESAENFLVDLGAELRDFNLSLNHKKTQILELPLASTSNWTRKLTGFSSFQTQEIRKYPVIKSFLDYATEIMVENCDSSVLNYAIKILGSQDLTNNARDLAIKSILNLSLLYPYLVPILDTHVFSTFNVNNELIERFTNALYNQELKVKNYEAVCYAIYFAIKYNFPICTIDINVITSSSSCILKLLSYIYYRQKNDAAKICDLETHAENLSKNTIDFENNWLFIYEILPQEKLEKEWSKIKQANISFIKP